MKIKTISGLPRTESNVPTEFKQVWMASNAFFQKFTFLSAYTLYKASITLNAVEGSIEQVKTCLIYQHKMPLMYAFVIDDGEKYFLAEIGGKYAYAVPKSDIVVETVSNYRMRFCSLKQDCDAIVETTSQGKIIAIFCQYKNGAESLIKKFLIPVSTDKASVWLTKKGF